VSRSSRHRPRFLRALVEPGVPISGTGLSDGSHTEACANRKRGTNSLGLGIQRLVEPPELRTGCQAHANSPPLDSLRRTPNQGPFPPPAFTGFPGTMRPSDSCRRLTLLAHRGRSPVLRPDACLRAAPSTPASGLVLSGRLLGPAPAAFAVLMAAQRSHLGFRGLLRLHTRCGPHACQPAYADSCPRGFNGSVTLPAARVATRVYRQLPGLNSHQLHQGTFTAPIKMHQNAAPENTPGMSALARQRVGAGGCAVAGAKAAGRSCVGGGRRCAPLGAGAGLWRVENDDHAGTAPQRTWDEAPILTARRERGVD